MKQHGWVVTCVAAGLLSLPAQSADRAAARPGAPVAACDALTKLGIPRLTITQAKASAASSDPALPAHCDVIGKFAERTGSDGKTYAIGFHLRMPDAWNGRFLFQGGGGVDGIIGEALGNFGPSSPVNPVSRGYAVVTMDSGHQIERDIPVVGAVTFGLDPEARIDYGYRALQTLTPQVKEILARHYGRPPDYSYFIGCSNGGRQAFMASQRFPELFDGVVAGAPGFNAPTGVINQMWYLQSWAAAATEKDANGQPYLATALSAQDQKLIGNAVLKACDARDGLEDGVVDDVVGCKFDPAVLQCTGEKTDQCLRPAQVTALKRHMSGPVNSKGERLAVDWPWDAGISAPGWRGRPLGTPTPERRNNASAVYLGGAALSYVFSTPPVTPGLNAPDAATASKEMVQYVLDYDFDRDPAAIRARSGAFTQSSQEWDVSDSTDLSRFKALGRKMIVYHGGSDPSWSLNDTLRWYKGVEARDASVRDFSRLFIVPGLNHCTGGPAMEIADFLTPLTEWVEQGRAPDRVVGTAKQAEDVPWPGRTRPFCVYPLQARYSGTGDIEKAENFVCRAP